MQNPRVVYWNNIPAPYMVERFNALSDKGNLDFEAWFNDVRHPERSWDVEPSTWRFRYRFMPTVKIGDQNLHFPLPLLTDRRPDVLVSLYAEASFVLGWLIAHWRGSATVFRVLATNEKWVKRHWIKEKVKHYLFANVDGIEVPGKDGKRFALQCGADESKIFFATHTVDTLHFRRKSRLGPIEHQQLRNKLGLRGITFIFVGRLWWGKGVNYLLDAFRELQKRLDQEISLLLVGDGEDDALLKKKCKRESIQNVTFAGFHQKAELPRFYAAADIFVFPTLGDPYGLVVDEAMACALPIISTNAAGEIRDRIEQGVNGYIVPPEDSNALSGAMEKVARDKELRKRMGMISAQKISGNTPERWAEDFEKAIDSVLDLPRSRGNPCKFL